MDFETIDLFGQEEYLANLKKIPQKISDLSFINLYGWAEEYGLKMAFAEGLYWIKQTRPREVFWPPVGDYEQDWASLLKKLDLLKPGTEWVRMPEVLVHKWQKTIPNLTIKPAREHWDYLYLVEELIELKGNRFHKKKNLLNQFLKKYDFVYRELETGDIEAALTLQAEWCLWKECADSMPLEAENKAIFRVLSNWSRLKNIFGGALWVEGKMIAYTVAEPLDEETLVIHFEKGCPNFKGVYQAINHLFLKNSAFHFKYVNREQDLGDLGLRKAKESYNPCAYLKKYKVVIG